MGPLLENQRTYFGNKRKKKHKENEKNSSFWLVKVLLTVIHFTNSILLFHVHQFYLLAIFLYVQVRLQWEQQLNVDYKFQNFKVTVPPPPPKQKQPPPRPSSKPLDRSLKPVNREDRSSKERGKESHLRRKRLMG